MSKYSEYDVVIVGAATTGSYLARKIAEAGNSVLIIDKSTAAAIGDTYDIFLIATHDIDRLGLPYGVEGDDFSFESRGVDALSAYGKWPKKTERAEYGLFKHKYTAHLNRWAQEAGVTIEFEAVFKELLYEDGKIAGLTYEKGGEIISVKSKLVADASGIPSVVRRGLPEGYGVENWEITSRDQFYIIVHFIKYLHEKDYLTRAKGWSFYKTWEGHSYDPKGGVIGIGANIGYETADKIWKVFTDTIQLPEHKIDHTQQGATPYRRPPYSFVADGFLVSGDAACLTKPSLGEGISSSMVHAKIAADVINEVLAEGKPLSMERLWPINKRYQEEQGEKFANTLATLVGAVATNAKENDFFFSKDIIFSQKTFEAMDKDEAPSFTTGEMISMAFVMLGGVITGKLRISTIKSLLNSMKNGGLASELYNAYPETPEGFEEWVKKADVFWDSVGSMAAEIEPRAK